MTGRATAFSLQSWSARESVCQLANIRTTLRNYETIHRKIPGKVLYSPTIFYKFRNSPQPRKQRFVKTMSNSDVYSLTMTISMYSGSRLRLLRRTAWKPLCFSAAAKRCLQSLYACTDTAGQRGLLGSGRVAPGQGSESVSTIYNTSFISLPTTHIFTHPNHQPVCICSLTQLYLQASEVHYMPQNWKESSSKKYLITHSLSLSLQNKVFPII